MLKKYFPLLLVLGFLTILFKDSLFFNKVPLPGDTLIGAYFPWLDYKWGYTVGVPVKNALTSDAFSQFFVWKKIFADAVTNYHLPLWNPTSFSGTPLMASFHSSVFNPGNVLFLFKNGWGLYIFFSFLASAIFMYQYLSLWTKDNRIKSLAALIYSFSGPMTTWAEFGTAVWAAAYFPLFFYFLHSYVAEPKKSKPFLIPISLSLLIFSGHVQIFTYVFLLLPIYLVYLYRRYQPSTSVLVKVVIFILLGLGLSSAQVLPTKEYYQRSIRSEERYSSSFNYGLSPIHEVVRLWAADFFGHPSSQNHFSSVSYHEYSSFLGFLSIPLVLFLWTNKKKDRIIFPSVIFIICLFLAYNNPLSRLIFKLPIPVLTYSSASRIFFLLNFASAILVTQSLEIIFTSKFQRRLLYFVIAFTLGTLLITFLVPIEFRMVSQRNSMYYLAIGLSFLILYPLTYKKPSLFFCLLILLYSLDLGRYFLRYNTFFPEKLVFPSTPIIDFLVDQEKPNRFARQNTNLLPANTWSYYNLESVEGYDPLYSSAYAHFFHLIKADPFDSLVSRYALLENIDTRYLDALNVKYFLALNVKNDDHYQIVNTLNKNNWKIVFSDKSVSVYQNPNVRPRAYFASNTEYVSSDQEMAAKVSSQKFDPRFTAIVQSNDSQIHGFDPDSKIAIRKYFSQGIDLDVSTATSSFMIVSNSFDPGWKAKVNGKPAVVYKTNASFLGLKINPGNSSVSLYYMPDTFITGLIISATALLIIFLSLLFV